MPHQGGAGETVVAAGIPGKETEIKIRLDSRHDFPTRLANAGFIETKPRIFEANTVYDRPDEELRKRGCLLRLREVGERVILTFKGPAERGKHKSREELETSLGDAVTGALILNRLGFSATFRYEKYRTEYERPGEHGVVTIDETPVGWFIELEGVPDWIDRTAGQLGFSESDYLTDSYGSLYVQYCEIAGIPPENMVFSRTT
jgi:adenylate cyclase, class 2